MNRIGVTQLEDALALTLSQRERELLKATVFDVKN